METKILKFTIFGEFPWFYDSTWGCRHTLKKISTAQHAIVTASMADLKFYKYTAAINVKSDLVITLNMARFSKMYSKFSVAEKPVFFCERCVAKILRRLKSARRGDIYSTLNIISL